MVPTGSAGSAGQPIILAAAAAFLRRHAPFDRMEQAALDCLTSRLALGYYPKGAVIVGPDAGEPQALYVIQRGLVRVEEGASAIRGNEPPLGPGETFPVDALMEGRPVKWPYVAAADTFCYQLPAADFRELLRASPHLLDFAAHHLASLLAESRRLLRMESAGESLDQLTASRTLRSVIRRAPVSCSPETPLDAALRTMKAERTGSIVVEDAERRPIGILTRHDVLDRVALAGAALDRPISDFMTAAPRTIAADATAYEAALVMASHGIRHLPVTDGAKLWGVVTERDLFALQRTSMRGIRRAIAACKDEGMLPGLAAEIRKLAYEMLRQGVAAGPLTGIVSTLNDALTGRVIELHASRRAATDIGWCWLAFGSEGRREQTPASDQDNGLVFVTEAAGAERQRETLLGFAQAVNRALAACGFRLCEGNIMAGNPRWCLTLDEWREQFSSWVRDPEPQALLNATIFFDFRALHGRAELAHALRDHLVDLVQGDRRFLRMLAEQALEIRPPTGIVREFVVEGSGPDKGTLDLKGHGARLFVDAARIIALATGSRATSTEARLREGGARLGFDAPATDAAIEAFHFIQLLRLRSAAAGKGNRLDPAGLNDVDRRILKECFRQARLLQTRIALDYQL